ncbi:HNH endonuclease [Parasediminibacterium sp. JCM 36343]|uniref:HNH endonuclease n=1 Tax=Parasediminibacterium sp. JCM 36343 TaxID=3374279 RepID=UPI00397BFA4E
MNKVEFLPNEEWVTLQLEDRKGLMKYAVSNFGRAISYMIEIENGRLMPLNVEPNRHTRLKIEFTTGSKSFYIHKIVAENFIPKPADPSLSYVIHINKNIKDNKYQNLQWATHDTYRQSLAEAHFLVRNGISADDAYKSKKIKFFVGEEYKEVDAGVTVKKYAITNFGRLISYYDSIENGTILQVGTHAQGYKIWHYKSEGKAKAYLIHRLVATYFLKPDTEEHKYVIHKDHNKTNNVVENLAWTTFEEQLKHADTSLAVIERKDNHRRRSEITGRGAKLTVGKVRLIKKILFDPKRTTRLKMIAKQFGISSMQLYRIQTGENWGWVKMDSEPETTPKKDDK